MNNTTRKEQASSWLKNKLQTDYDKLENWKPQTESDKIRKVNKLNEAKNCLEVFNLILKLQEEEIDSHKTALRTSAVMTRTLGKLTDKLIGTDYQNDEVPIIKAALDE